VPLRMEVECETAQTFRRGRNGLDVCLPDHGLRRGGPAHLTEPAPGGRPPIGPPWVADLVPQQAGCAPSLGRVERPEGLFPRSAPIAPGCIVDGGARHRGALPGAPQPGQVPSVTPVGCDPVARLFGQQGGGDAPAARAFFQQGALEPGAAGARFIDADALLTLRLQLP
jgi:hypothetical protein